jgi:hypothetical protein
VIHRHVVREHGVALAGPDPRTLIDPVDARDLRAAVVSLVVSKPLAARWAQASLDARWTPLIQAALAWSNDTVPDLGETLRFMDDTRQASRSED